MLANHQAAIHWPVISRGEVLFWDAHDRFKGQDAQLQLVLCLRFVALSSKPRVITYGDGPLAPAENVAIQTGSHKVMLAALKT